MRVLLACEPPLLREVLAFAIRDIPGVEIVWDGEADAMVWNGPGGPDGAECALLIMLSPTENVIRVTRTHGSARWVETTDGDLRSLLEVLRTPLVHLRLSAPMSLAASYHLPSAGTHTMR